MARKFITIRQYQRSIGRQCMHCRRPATVTAVSMSTRFRHFVRYCRDHAIELGVIAPDSEEE